MLSATSDMYLIEPTISTTKMKNSLIILFTVCFFFSSAAASAQGKQKPKVKAVTTVPASVVPANVVPANELMPFDKFFKKTMKITPGEFTVYQDDSKYFLEIPAAALNTDLLVIGEIIRGYSQSVAQSSGIVRFIKATGNNLNVTREVYKEALSPDFNQGMESLVQKSNLIPVSFVLQIEAAGKTKGSYIIDVTRQLMEGGDLFSFKDVSDLSNSDAARSGVQQVKVGEKGVVFTVLRTQTQPGNNVNGNKAVDRAIALMLNLSIQRLPDAQMKVREADVRVGFGTVNYNDFGKNPYGVRNVKVITKWNLEVKAADRKKYAAGELVEPLKPISIFIDPVTPAPFVPAIKKAIQQWNTALEAAGFKNALVVMNTAKDNWLSAGKLLIEWGSPGQGLPTNVVTDPRTGEILAAKMDVGDNLINDLLPSYFAKCAFIDPRIKKDLYHPEVRKEILEWKVATALGELLGMIPNLHGSAAYSPKQLRSGAWLKTHSFTSSITDDTEFNYVLQPGDQVDVADLLPHVSSYDKMAVGWAYRVFSETAAEKKALASLKSTDAELLFLEENKNDPFTRKGDLSDDQLEASELGMKNVERYYLQVEQMTAAMKDKDEDWTNFKILSNAFQKSYQLYTDNVVSYIGGISTRPMLKDYNDVPVIYTSKKEQKNAMALLNTWFFNGPPVWMQSKQMNLLNNESEAIKMGRSTQDALRKFITPEVLNNLIKAEYALGKDAYTVSDLFADLDRYVFKDFDTTLPFNEYIMLMQNNFVYDLTDAAVKNTNITGGLTDASEVLHMYFIRTMAHVGEMGEKHQDPRVRERYKMMKQKIERDINQKPN